jgi:hypothetical protein
MKVAEHVIIRNQVFRAEEKAPFPISGRSVRGAIELDLGNDQIKCHECGDWFSRLGSHLRTCGVHPRDYKIKHGLRQTATLTAPGLAARLRASSRLPRNSDASALLKYRKLNRTMRPTLDELRNERNICPDQCIAKVKRIASVTGGSPTASMMPKEYQSAIRFHFGTHNELLRRAGLSVNQIAQYDRESLRDMLVVFYALNQRLPRRSDWGSASLPSSSTFRKYFGTTLDAFIYAGLGLVAGKQSKKKEAA